MGMVVVASCAARAAGVFGATMTSTLSRIPVRAAPGACSSSRPSPPAASPSIGLLRPYRRSGSTPHDDVQPTCSTQCRRCTMLVLDRQCERLLRRGRSTLIRHSNVPSDRQLRASNGSDALSRHRSSLQRAQPIAPHHHRLRGQIAIERAAPSVPHLPRLRALQVCRRRPLVCVAASVMAGIRKPLQRETKLSCASHLRFPLSSRRNTAPPRNVGQCQFRSFTSATDQ